MMRNTYSLSWNRKRTTKTVKVSHENHRGTDGVGWYSHKHTLERIEERCTGDFVVEIDIDQIVSEVMGRAAQAKTGRSRLLHGLIRARKISEKVLSAHTEHYPISPGYFEVVPEKVP